VNGKLGITKRGPGQVRQLLYLAALRLVKSDPTARAWYHARKAYRAGVRVKALVAVTRKLARALWHVARGAAFDVSKLFDKRRLGLTSESDTTSTTKSVVAPSHPVTSETTREGGAALA
jgi:hypothetical protein